MEPVDMNKLEVALIYVQRMSEGNNPVTNQPAAEEDVLNNPNVIRCMYFIRDVLAQVKDNKGVIGGRPSRAKKNPFPFETLENFRYERDTSISYLMKQIGELAGDDNTKSPGTKAVTDYLKNMEYLREEVNPRNNYKIPCITEKGKRIGLYLEHRTSVNGNEYDIVMYSRQAQEFIVKNLERIVNGEMTE